MRLITAAVLFFVLSAFASGQQIMSEQKEQSLRALVPVLPDETDDYILHEDETTVFYTLAEMPRAFQFAGNNGLTRTGFHWAGHNFSGDNNAPFFSSSQPHGRDGNANVDFPWRMDTPGGTHRSPNVFSFKAFWNPKKEDGSKWPVVIFTQNLFNPISGQRFDPAWGWVFPEGFRIYEVLYEKDPDGRNHVFEVRRRERRLDSWDVEVYRQFPTAVTLAESVKQLQPDWQNRPDLVRLVAHLENPDTPRRATIEDRVNRSKRAFHIASGVDVIPDINDDALTTRLLTTTPFKYSSGEVWKPARDGVPPTFYPHYEGNKFHVVPAKNDISFLGGDSKSCMNCHVSTAVHARVFDQGRGWYGYVSGSDGIISWHPVEPRTIAANGNGNAGFQWRTSFGKAGIIALYDSNKHPDTVYRRIKGVK